jgi:hypothetical protein
LQPIEENSFIAWGFRCHLARDKAILRQRLNLLAAGAWESYGETFRFVYRWNGRYMREDF